MEAEDTTHLHPHGVLAAEGTERRLEAYMLEFGVTVHSVFVGLALGVADHVTTKALLVAVSFHQFFEGVALGSRFVDATSLPLRQVVFNSLVFALSSPAGVASGVGVRYSLDPQSRNFLFVQGFFDAICGGILLYLGFLLLLLDFPEDAKKAAREFPARKYSAQFGMFAFLWLGAALMAFVGKYV